MPEAHLCKNVPLIAPFLSLSESTLTSNISFHKELFALCREKLVLQVLSQIVWAYIRLSNFPARSVQIAYVLCVSVSLFLNGNHHGASFKGLRRNCVDTWKALNMLSCAWKGVVPKRH